MIVWVAEHHPRLELEARAVGQAEGTLWTGDTSSMTEAAAWRVVLRGILLVFGLVVAVFLARQLQSVIVQLLLAVLVAAAATPLVDAVTVSQRAQGWRWRPARSLAALLVFLAALLILVLGGTIVVASIAPDLSQLSTNLPVYVARTQTAIDTLLAGHPELAGRVNSILPSLETVLGGAAGLLGQASRVLGVATAVFGGVLYLIFTLILALYLTIDGDRIRRYLIRFLPLDRQGQAELLSASIGSRLGAWARGEALLAAIIGTLTWLSALAIGLPYVAALALIAAVGELIPNLGPIIAAIPLIAVGFLSSPQQGLLAIALAILVQQLENNLIVPRVMGHAVDLHPVAVMLAILAGNELLGIPGALLAVPVVASLSVILDEIQRERLARRSLGTRELRVLDESPVD
jgi:predicted PurR-regulated permease PerM